MEKMQSVGSCRVSSVPGLSHSCISCATKSMFIAYLQSLFKQQTMQNHQKNKQQISNKTSHIFGKI